MIIRHLATGPLQVNTYIVGSKATGDAVVIDPGGHASEILRVLEQENLTLRRIINTHAHFDHVGGVNDLKTATGVPFCLHPDDLGTLAGYAQQMAFFGMQGDEAPDVDEHLEAGQVVEIGELSLTVLFTPGHAPGHVTFVSPVDITGPGDRVAFSGDVLFQGSIGRYDLPGADLHVLMSSITEQLLPLGDNTVIYPGHGPMTTIGEEKLSNPFLRAI